MSDTASALIGWVSVLLVLVVWVLLIGRIARRQRAMIEASRNNTQAVKANTEALLRVAAKLEDRAIP